MKMNFYLENGHQIMELVPSRLIVIPSENNNIYFFNEITKIYNY